MLHWEHSAILLTFIKLPLVIKIFVLSIFEWPFYTGFTLAYSFTFSVTFSQSHSQHCIQKFSVTINPLWTGNPIMGTLANSEDPDEMPHIAAVRQSLHCLLRQNLSPEKEIQYILKIKVSQGAKIRNRYNQVPHLTQDTNGKVTHSQLDTTNESQEVSPFPAGDHKAHINRHAQRHSKHKTEKI